MNIKEWWCASVSIVIFQVICSFVFAVGALLNELGVVVLTRRRRKQIFVHLDRSVHSVFCHHQLTRVLVAAQTTQTFTLSHSHTLAQEAATHLLELHALIHILGASCWILTVPRGETALTILTI